MGSEQHHRNLAAEVVRESVTINFTVAEKHDPAVVGVGLHLLMSGISDSIILGLGCTPYSGHMAIPSGQGLIWNAGETSSGKRCVMFFIRAVLGQQWSGSGSWWHNQPFPSSRIKHYVLLRDLPVEFVQWLTDQKLVSVKHLPKDVYFRW